MVSLMLFGNIILLSSWMSIWTCQVLATEYDRMLIFKEPIPGEALPGHVIETDHVSDEGSCRVKCYLEPNCVSINVGPVTEEQLTCELNNHTDESTSHSSLEERKDYTHYAVENFCHGDPCPVKISFCQVGFTSKGYRCVCHKGFITTGDHGQCEECYNALGMETGAISDVQISASSEFNSNHAARQGRLNFQETGVKSGAWVPKDDHPWLQVDVGNQNTKVTRVATQGRTFSSQWPWGPHSQWVTKYKLQYSDNGINFSYYEDGNSIVKELTGNTDQDTVVYQDLNPPISARFIRFLPTAWRDQASMRVELYGCYE